MAWMKLGPAYYVPAGEMKSFQAGETEILVVHLDQQFVGLDARCSHAGAPLSEGELDGIILSCPWHGSRFDVTDGRVLQGPAEQPLKVYRVKVLDSDLYVET